VIEDILADLHQADPLWRIARLRYCGTGVRDYIHVCDLAEGHVAALEYLNRQGGTLMVNLGTGQGYSVLEMVKAFEKASGRAIPCKIGPRRAGDSAKCLANPALAQQLTGWKAALTRFTIQFEHRMTAR